MHPVAAVESGPRRPSAASAPDGGLMRDERSGREQRARRTSSRSSRQLQAVPTCWPWRAKRGTAATPQPGSSPSPDLRHEAGRSFGVNRRRLPFRRRRDTVERPYRRLLDEDDLDAEAKRRLTERFLRADPEELQERIDAALDRLDRLGK